MKRRMKKTTKQYIMVAIICLVVIGGAAATATFVMVDSVNQKHEIELAKVNEALESNMRTAYIAIQDISPGEIITEDKVVVRSVYAGQPQECFMTQADIGKTALIPIQAETFVLSAALSEQEVDPELREVEYDVININTNVVDKDTVDVRVMYPNGENYIVLSKKIIRNYTPEFPNCFFWMDAEEILRMSAAIVDAALYPGTVLYTTKYVEPAIQEGSKVTYTPSLSTLSLIENDPNIVERSSQQIAKDVRKALENRLALSANSDVNDVDWNVDSDMFPGYYIDEEPEDYTTPTPTPTPEMIETGDAGDDQGFYEVEDDSVYYTDENDDFFYYSEEEDDMKGVAELGQ